MFLRAGEVGVQKFNADINRRRQASILRGQMDREWMDRQVITKDARIQF